MENNATTPASKPNRYRVLMSEVLSYCVDVLAENLDEASEIAIATELKGEPDTVSFDVDSCEVIAAEDTSFCPINACSSCLGPMEDFEKESMCRACKKAKDAELPTVRAASQELYDRLQDYLDVSDAELIEQGHKGLVEAMDKLEAAWHKADGTKPEEN